MIRFLYNVYLSTRFGDQTPSWFLSCPKGEIFGNIIIMVAYVFLDGKSLANNEVYVL